MKREHDIDGELPSEYRRLEYIEATGTQYIDCAYIPDYTLEWYDDFQLTGNQTFSTGFTSYTNGQMRFLKERYGNDFKTQYGATPNDNTSTAHSIDNDRHTWLLSNGKQVFDDAVYANDICENCNNTLKMTLFARNDGSIRYKGKMKLFLDYQKINGNYIRYYIPALRLSDSKPGLYDLCESICPLTDTPFYVNAGTGEFLYK